VKSVSALYAALDPYAWHPMSEGGFRTQPVAGYACTVLLCGEGAEPRE